MEIIRKHAKALAQAMAYFKSYFCEDSDQEHYKRFQA